MTNRSSRTGSAGELVGRLGGLLMALVAGKDLRVRQMIASAVTRARPQDDLEFEARWQARQQRAATRRVE